MAGALLILVALSLAAWGAVSPGPFSAGGRLLVGVLLPWGGAAALLLSLAAGLFRRFRAPAAGNACLGEGQRRALPWLRPAGLSAPASRGEARLRLWRDLLSCRSLRHNSRLLTHPETGGPVNYPAGWLRLAVLVFHYSLLLVLLRHLALWLDPLPVPLAWLAGLDGFFQLRGQPFYLSSALLPAALLFLLGRRLFNPLLRRISRPADYFALLLLLALCGSGLGLRYFAGADPAAVRAFCRGLVSFSPALSEDLPRLFYLHLFFLGLLLLYIPVSKLRHAAAAWFSPTRAAPLGQAGARPGKAAAERRRRPESGGKLGPVQSYVEYAALFRAQLLAAGLTADEAGDAADFAPAPEFAAYAAQSAGPSSNSGRAEAMTEE